MRRTEEEEEKKKKMMKKVEMVWWLRTRGIGLQGGKPNCAHREHFVLYLRLKRNDIRNLLFRRLRERVLRASNDIEAKYRGRRDENDHRHSREVSSLSTVFLSSYNPSSADNTPDRAK